MSDRKTIRATRFGRTTSGGAPSCYVGIVAAQVRLHFPPNAHPADVRVTLSDVLADVYRELAKWEAERGQDPDARKEVVLL